MNLLSVENLVKRFGSVVATDHAALAIARGEIHAVIGPNGAGKTTLIDQVAGELRPDAGRILFDGLDITAEPLHRRARRGIGRSYQITSVFAEFSVLENVLLAAQAHVGSNFSFWRPAHADPLLIAPAHAAVAKVGLAVREHTPVAALGHGERRQLELAMTLVTQPKLLLLDEPTAGMSHHESRAMVALLRTLRDDHTMLLVEHDMDVVFALADRITVLVYGRTIACGRPEDIRSNPDVRDAYLGDADEDL